MFGTRLTPRAGQPKPSQETREESTTPEVLVRLDADVAEDGSFGHRVLEVTADTVRMLEGNGAVSFQVPIAEIRSARNEPLIGGGRLELIGKTGEVIPVVSYSLTLAAKFSEAARGIE